MANAKGNIDNLKPVRTKEEAKKRGSVGGKKSGDSRRKKRDVRQAISLLLNMAAKENIEKNLKQLGYNVEDLTNMNALMARLFTKAMTGDVAAFKALMDYGGFHPDQELRDKERRTRIAALEVDGECPDQNDDKKDAEDIVIYLPNNGKEVSE